MTTEANTNIVKLNRNWAKISSAIGAAIAYIAGLQTAGVNVWEDWRTVLLGVATTAFAAYKTGNAGPGKVSQFVSAVKQVSAGKQNSPNPEMYDMGEDPNGEAI